MIIPPVLITNASAVRASIDKSEEQLRNNCRKNNIIEGIVIENKQMEIFERILEEYRLLENTDIEARYFLNRIERKVEVESRLKTKFNTYGVRNEFSIVGIQDEREFRVSLNYILSCNEILLKKSIISK